MTFKEECLQLYKESGKRSEIEREKRTAERVGRNRGNIIKNFELNFKRPFKQEYLTEEINKHGNVSFTLQIDEIKILVNFQDSNYAQYFLYIFCQKCGQETTYKNRLDSSFLRHIGKILNESISNSKYNRTCSDCLYEENQLKQILRTNNYNKRIEEREKDLFKNLADALVEVLRRGGYRDLYNEDVET